MLLMLCFFIGLTGFVASSGNCCRLKNGNITINGDSGLCPCKDDYVLGWTFDDVCDCKCIAPRDGLNCQKCPDVLQQCAETCCFLDVVCDGDVCRPADALDFATVAKIAILFALIVTCLAVLFAFIRAFLLPKCCPRGRMRAATTTSDSRSLNSVQRFVVDRLRSRPPPYEHQPEKPPSYEDCLNSENGSPPPYGIAVINLMSEPPSYHQQSNTRASDTEQFELVPIPRLSNPIVLNPQALILVPSEPETEEFAVLESENTTHESNGVENGGFEIDEVSRN